MNRTDGNRSARAALTACSAARNLRRGGFQIRSLRERLHDGGGGIGDRDGVGRQGIGQGQVAIERQPYGAGQRQLVFAQVGCQRIQPLLLGLQLHQGAHDVDTGVGAGLVADARLIVYGLRVGHLCPLRIDARRSGCGLQIGARHRDHHQLARVLGRQVRGPLQLLAGLQIPPRHRVVYRFTQGHLRLRIIVWADHGGDGEAETGRHVEDKSECRQIGLRHRIGGVQRDVRQQRAERLQAPGAGGGARISCGDYAEVVLEAHLDGIRERHGDRSRGRSGGGHAALQIAVDLHRGAEGVDTGGRRALLHGNRAGRAGAAGFRQNQRACRAAGRCGGRELCECHGRDQYGEAGCLEPRWLKCAHRIYYIHACMYIIEG